MASYESGHTEVDKDDALTDETGGVLIHGKSTGDGTAKPVATDDDGHLQVDVLSGGSGGTEYTEDEAAAADPVGGVQVLVRQDTPAGLVSTDGDNVARRGTNYGAAFSQILDSAGNFVDTFGGGTQYTEGDTDASITGTAMLGEAPADTLEVLQLDASKNLKTTLQTSIPAGTNNIGDVDVLTLPKDGQATMANSIPVVLASDQSAVPASQSGTWNINDISGTISLPTGAATAANQLPDGHNVTVDNAVGASAVNIQDGGNVISVDDGAGSLTVDQGTHDNLNCNANVQVGDADNSETNPVFIGHIAESSWTTPTNIVTTYDDGTSYATSQTSAAITRIAGCFYADVSIELSKANSPTDLRIYIREVGAGAGSAPVRDGWQSLWIYDDTIIGSGFHENLRVRIPADNFDIYVVGTGLSASATFTIDAFRIKQISAV